MTLIEVLFFYSNLVRTLGRKTANARLVEIGVDKTVAKHIRETVSDNGKFLVGADGLKEVTLISFGEV